MLCVTCKKFYGSFENRGQCSFCFDGFVAPTQAEIKNYEDNFQENIENLFKKYKITRLSNSEFKILKKISKSITPEELFAILLGERELPRVGLSYEQSWDLYKQCKDLHKNTDIQRAFDLVTLLFCVDCENEKNPRNTSMKCHFYFGKSSMTEDHWFEISKSWKFRKSLLYSYSTDCFQRNFVLTNCYGCSKHIRIRNEFDECSSCHHLLCETCYDSITTNKYTLFFTNEKNEKKIERYSFPVQVKEEEDQDQLK
eukprot:gene11450-4615_t